MHSAVRRRAAPTSTVVASIAAASIVATTVLATSAQAVTVRPREWQVTYFNYSAVARHSTGAGVTVAVVDTGVQASHPDLTGRVLPGRSFVGGQATDDASGHGTAMAGLIAGHGHDGDGVLGLAPGVKILPVRVAYRNPSPRAAAAGIRWAVGHGAKVINVSLGGGAGSAAEHSAVDYAQSHDVVVVASTGNHGNAGLPVSYPAAYPGVVAVAGMTRTGKAWANSQVGRQVAVAAPAKDVISDANRGDYALGQGTSNAAALTSAEAALIRSQHPQLNAASVIKQIISTATDAGPSGRDSHYGFGVINPLAAVTRPPRAVTRNPLLGPATESTPATSSSAGVPPSNPPLGSSSVPSTSASDEDSGHGHSIATRLIGGALGLLLLTAIMTGIVLIARRRSAS